jgi:hypothetical protein
MNELKLIFIDWQYADKRQKSIRYGGDMSFRISPEMDFD